MRSRQSAGREAFREGEPTRTLPVSAHERVLESLDARTLEILERRRGIAIVKRRGWLMRRMLAASDLAGLALSFALTEWIYGKQTDGGLAELANETLIFGLSLPLWIIGAKLYGLYDRDEERAGHSTMDDIPGIFQLVTIVSWLLLAGTYLTGLANPQLPKLLTFWVFAIVSVPLLRSAARVLGRRSIHYLQNTVIVGASDVGQAIARKLLKHPEYGINLVGFIDAQPEERAEGIVHVSLLGALDDLPGLVRLLDIERVIVASPGGDREALLTHMRKLNDSGIQVDLVPRFYDVLSSAVDIHDLEGILLVGLRPPRLSRSSMFLKRGLDIFGAVIGLVLMTPLLLLTAIAVKLDSRGPVLFRQLRMGVGNRAFRIMKFRTMDADADEQKAKVAHLNKHAQDGGGARMFKIDNDPRVTRVGRVLRRVSLDELPQLWNVLRGEMSLVGPRPLILDEHAHVTGWAERRLDLRPGITGLWQVLGRDGIPFDEMVRLDYLYVTNWSLGGDVRLLLRTIPVVFRGASRG